MIDKQQVKLHFSKNASNYDQYANVQKKMKDILIEFMLQDTNETFKAKKILEIGCGTGYLTRTLTELFPSAHITAVDIAPGMISEIKPKFQNESVDFICGDIEEMELKDTYDIIISNATFQWFNYMPTTMKKMYSALNQNGILCFSTFGNYTFQELNECFKHATQLLSINDLISSGQRFYSLNELTKLCENIAITDMNADESLVQSQQLFEYEYFDNCKDFLYSIKKTGANNSNESNKCTSPTFIKKVIDLYNENFKENNKVKATYHCLFYKVVNSWQ